MRLAKQHELLLGLTDQELLELAPQAEYQHYKGGLYSHVSIDTSTYTATYRHTYPYSPLTHQRPLEDFEDFVTLSDDSALVLFCSDTCDVGDIVPRFRKLNKVK